MLASLPCSLPDGPRILDLPAQDHHHAHPEQRKRWTEAVYAVCVFVTGALLLITAV